MRDRNHVALTTLALLCATAALAAPTNYPPANQPLAGPPRAIEDLAQGFRDRSPDEIGAVLTADYTFHSAGMDLSLFTQGNARAAEMDVVRNMLLGVKRGDKYVMQPAERVDLVVDGVSEQIDPEHPDSTQHYRVLTVRHFEMVLHMPGSPDMPGGHDMNTALAGQTHVFQVVRGDAAVRVDGQSADPSRWYVRRWLEDVSGVRDALNERKGECGDEPAAEPAAPSAANPTPAVPGVLAIHALTNPACRALQVRCDLPGAERAKVQVYDVSGRLMNERDVAVTGPGTITVEAGAGARLTPGVYWVRLMQAKRTPDTRMVVVAR
jgi:hypothetical protein